jgi:hypothetical protein
MAAGDAISQVDMNNVKDAVLANSSEVMKQTALEIFKQLSPLIEILGGLIGLYIIIKIIQAISDLLLKKRIKRMDRNLQEILEILRTKTTIKKKK